MARADAGPEPSPTTMPLVTNLSTWSEAVGKSSLGNTETQRLQTSYEVSLTVSLAASKRSTTSASAAEAEQATPRRRTEEGGQLFRRGLGHGRSCNDGATLGLAMASMD